MDDFRRAPSPRPRANTVSVGSTESISQPAQAADVWNALALRRIDLGRHVVHAPGLHIAPRAFADPEVSAVLCAAGGGSTAKILPHLDAEVFRANPKPFLGRSNNMYLNTFPESQAGARVVHRYGVPRQFGEHAVLRETL
jgi:hypothetical protein